MLAQSRGRLVFDALTSTEFTLRVVSDQTNWNMRPKCSTTPSEILGAAQFTVHEDIISVVGFSGELSLPLLQHGRICGNVSMFVNVVSENGVPWEDPQFIEDVHPHFPLVPQQCNEEPPRCNALSQIMGIDKKAAESPRVHAL